MGKVERFFCFLISLFLKPKERKRQSSLAWYDKEERKLINKIKSKQDTNKKE